MSFIKTRDELRNLAPIHYLARMKIPHPVNFRFDTLVRQPKVTPMGDGVLRVEIPGEWESHHGEVKLHARPQPDAGGWSIGLAVDGTLQLIDLHGRCWLEGDGSSWFGTSGEAWMLRLRHGADMRFFGLGEKAGPLEKTGLRTEFWNTDVWGEHPLAEVRTGAPDPQYVSIPWLVVDREVDGVHKAIGVLVNHPGRVFFSLNPDMRLHPCQDSVAGGSFYLGAPGGAPELWILVDNDVEALCAKLSRLLGTMPCPPLWALGHHQCRWGYQGKEDLLRLDEAFRRHRVPCDGLWLDIDYMDAFQVFTTNPVHMPRVPKVLADLRAKGRRVVAILDPGVKDLPGYSVRDEGVARDLFCRNVSGGLFHGFVWPGATLFPDFSLPETRDWWAQKVADFTRLGFAGYWLDMNDPATGSVPESDMLFRRGSLPHWAWHNQYANGMAEATRAGLMAARPNETPFLITRSASTGIGRLSAVWMGDNFSSWHHLRQSIPMALNLSMSGVPFVGADVPGFGDDASPELMQRWIAAHCLFPFLRNHSVKDSIPQEPWELGDDTLDIYRRFVELRYRLLPFLESLFQRHEACGDLILRPYFTVDDMRDAHLVEDQFLVGPDLLVAPVMEPGVSSRMVRIPPGEWWLGLDKKIALQGRQSLELPCPCGELILLVRKGASIPMLRKAPKVSTDEIDLSDFETLTF